MSKITAPKSNIPVGRLTIGNVTYDIPQHPEFARFFYDLVKRAGGTSAFTNAELEEQIVDNALGPVAAPAIASDDALLLPRLEPLPAADDPNARVQALEAEVSRLARAVHDLQLGYQL